MRKIIVMVMFIVLLQHIAYALINSSNKKITLHFQNIQIRAALQTIAKFAAINMVISDSVHGTLSLNLKEVSWQQALEVILKTEGLSQRKLGNSLLIAPAEELIIKDDLSSELIPVRYAEAEQLATIIKDNKFLTSRGNISVDKRTNSLWISDVPKKISIVRTFINKLDIPVKQVLIEA